jgi:hypothetical protein
MSKYWTIEAVDGFGSQYQKIIESYIWFSLNNERFAYTPLGIVEHNYTNDPNYSSKLEELMNIKDNIINVNDTMEISLIEYNKHIYSQFGDNINECCNSKHMQFIKECFWKNKDKNHFKNDKINVAIHIRRENIADKGEAGERATTPNSYYLEVMEHIRKKYRRNLLFHIYSQGDFTNFKEFVNTDVVLNLNTDVIDSFIGMVAADILVTSPSSLSYVAALISDGEIYYKPFWHKPRKGWISCL